MADDADQGQAVEFTFATEPPLAHAVSVVQFRGEEALSELYGFEIEVAGEHATFALEDLLEQRATLRLSHDGLERFVQGVIARVQHRSGEHQTVRTVFSVVPALWFLTQRQHCRIYQELTTPEIVERVLADAGLYAGRTEWRLTDPGVYEKRTYCVQYCETDYQFVSRLLEDEGIYFFFEHPADGPERVVFCDGNQLQAIEGPSELRYREDTGQRTDDEHVLALGLVAEARPGAVVLRDFNYDQPRLDLEASSALGRPGEREVYSYPGGYGGRAEGRRRARARLESLRATALRGTGSALVTRMQPGRTFSLVAHPRDEFDRAYVLWRVKHRGVAPETVAHEAAVQREHPGVLDAESSPPRGYRYSCWFECTPREQPVRPPVRTPWPRMHGSQTATVVGPGGEEIYVDEQGRIKVQFHWDREGARDEKSSCWVRVATGWSGGGFGAVMFPRIGMEVVVDFLEGDPDRPMVTGCVFNGVNSGPHEQPANKTRTSWVTASSPGGGGFNELTFDDAAGTERVHIRAQKNFEELVLNDHSTVVQRDQLNHVQNNHTEKVDVDQSLAVGQDRTKKVSRHETSDIGANKVQTIGANKRTRVGAHLITDVAATATMTVASHAITRIGANAITNIVGNAARSILGSKQDTVKGSARTMVAGSSMETVARSQVTTVGAGQVNTVTRAQVTNVKGTQTTNVAKSHAITAGKDSTIKVGKSSILVEPKKITITVGGSTITIEDGKITMDNGKGADVSFKDGEVLLHGKEKAVVDSETKSILGSAERVEINAQETKIIGSPVRINC